MTAPARVAVFGGSFNPPHVAHVLAIAYVLAFFTMLQVLGFHPGSTPRTVQIVDTPASEVETDVVLFPRVQATWADANGQPQSLAGGPFSMKFGPEEKGLDTAMQNLVRTAEATWKRVQAMALAKTNPGKSVVLLGQSANLFLAAGATDAAAAANNMASVIKSGSQMKAVDAGRSAMLARKAAAASFDDL